jgi:hypothetical protein
MDPAAVAVPAAARLHLVAGAAAPASTLTQTMALAEAAVVLAMTPVPQTALAVQEGCTVAAEVALPIWGHPAVAELKGLSSSIILQRLRS